MNEKLLEKDSYTCHAVCLPCNSLAACFKRYAISRGEQVSKQRDLWLSDDPGLSILKCGASERTKARAGKSFLKALRDYNLTQHESLGSKELRTDYYMLDETQYLEKLEEVLRRPTLEDSESTVIQEAPLVIVEIKSRTSFVALDISQYELSHVGTITELLVEQPVHELMWLIGCDFILQAVERKMAD